MGSPLWHFKTEFETGPARNFPARRSPGDAGAREERPEHLVLWYLSLRTLTRTVAKARLIVHQAPAHGVARIGQIDEILPTGEVRAGFPRPAKHGRCRAA